MKDPLDTPMGRTVKRCEEVANSMRERDKDFDANKDWAILLAYFTYALGLDMDLELRPIEENEEMVDG